jgi:uncharacterized protein (TIGR02145 family)
MPTQITWNWNAVNGASGYKWNTTNTYSTAIDMGAATTKTETGLSCNTTYTRYVWAYNSCDTSEVTILVDTTLACTNCGQPVIDVRNGKSYNTVAIGSQCWMKENMNIGNRLDHLVGQTNDGGIEKHCYEDQESLCDIYGGLYPWHEAVQYFNGAAYNASWNPVPTTAVVGICPNGWHIPSYDEWETMVNYLGGATVAGGKLKEAGFAHWASPNTGADNSSGFTALPGGSKPNIYYYNIFTRGAFWIAKNVSNTSASYAGLVNTTAAVDISQSTEKATGLSVRCMRDTCTVGPSVPIPGTHLPTPTQIIWYWGDVPGALGYKWNTVNDYSTATDLGKTTTKTDNGLVCNTAYTRYVWAYNACGYSVGLMLSQSTSPCSGSCGQPFTDSRNNKTYNTVLIGNQCWMRENMNIGGRLGAQVAQTNNATIEKYCLNESEIYCNLYGAMYQWGEAVQYLNGASNTGSWNPVPTGNVTGICPNGWHIPSGAEVDTLASYLGGYPVAGGKMKDFGTSHWSSPNTGATNSSLFTALPGGYKPNVYYYGWMDLGYFWLASETDPTHASHMLLTFQSASLAKNAASKPYGYSVRCLKNCEPPSTPTSGVHIAMPTQITWNWNAVNGASGYKWNTTNDYASATDMGTATTKTETGLICNTIYSRYVWSYNACGSSTPVILDQETLPCPWTCGQTITVTHITGSVAPVSKTVTYGTVTNIPGETSKCWISQNLGSDHQADSINDATEASAGWYWQFNRKQGYKHDGVNVSPAWTIISIIENSDWLPANDPCSLEIGSSWRIATYYEWSNIYNTGGWSTSIEPWNSALKLHGAGYLDKLNGFLNVRGEVGYYYTSTQEGFVWELGTGLGFGPGGSGWLNLEKANAYSIRCIKE